MKEFYLNVAVYVNYFIIRDIINCKVQPTSGPSVLLIRHKQNGFVAQD